MPIKNIFGFEFDGFSNQNILGLDMTLKFQFRDLSLVRAAFDFKPDQAESNMLTFKSGEVTRLSYFFCYLMNNCRFFL